MATFDIKQRPLELLAGYQYCAEFLVDFTEDPTAIADVIEFGLIEEQAVITGAVIEVLVAGTGLADLGSDTATAALFDNLDLSALGITRSAGTMLDTRIAGERVIQIITAGAEAAGKFRLMIEYNKPELF